MEKKLFRQFIAIGILLLCLLIANNAMAADVVDSEPQANLDDLTSLLGTQNGFLSVAAQTAVCGNAILESGESCDDGNTSDADGCSATCQIENGWTCTAPIIGNFSLDEGFESGVAIPAGWTTQRANASYSWNLNTTPNEARTGSYSADILYDPSSSAQDEWLISPLITPSAASRLYFATKGSPAWCRDTYDNCDVEVWLLVGAIGGGDDIQLGLAEDAWSAEYTWANSSFDLPDNGTYSVAFHYVGTDGAQAFLDDVQVGENIPSSCTQIAPDGIDLGCNLPTVGFESGIPTDWQVVDNEGNGVVWTNAANSGESGNFTGGFGDVASVSSDKAGTAEYDTELRSNIFDLDPATTVTLNYLANYQNLAHDFGDLDISTDGGSSWTTLTNMNWNEDHGFFRVAAGEAVSVDLSPYAGNSNVMLRWRYYNPNANDNDWYAQVDEASLTCDIGTANKAVDFSDLGNSADVAWHEEPVAGRTLWLGSLVDNDANALRGTDNTTDDGATLTSRWVSGQLATIDVAVTGSAGFLTAWVDWDDDGFDAGDIITNQAQAVVPGTNVVSFTVPNEPTYKTGDTVQVRFRLALNNTVTVDGLMSDGEVEDYVFDFTPTAVFLSSFSVQTPTAALGLVILFGLLLIMLGSWIVYKRE